MSSGAIVVVFVGVLLGLGLVAAVVVMLGQPPPPAPPCQPGQPCAPPPPSFAPPGGSPAAVASPQPSGSLASFAPTPVQSQPVPTSSPVSNAPPAVSGTLFADNDLHYSFEYDADVFTLADSGDGVAILNGNYFDAQVIVAAVPADTSPRQLIADELDTVDRFLIGRVPDVDDYDALLGPSIGYIDGEGGVYSGTLVSRDGTPLAPGGVTLLASSDGRLTVVVVVIVGTPDARLGDETQQHAVRTAADDILKTFDWDTR